VTTLIIGGGFSGIAAAWAIARRGRAVRLIWEGPGASCLYSGALDRVDWGGPPDPRPLVADAEAFLAELRCFAPAGVGARVATSAGLLRPARCRDRAVLDLEPLRGRRISVVDFQRPGWDAAALARAYSESAWARHSRTEFQPLAVDLGALGAGAPELEALRLLPASELAARADDPAWAERLAPARASAGDGQSPLLFGPWLGLLPESIEHWRELLRRPIGETLSEPGGAAGARYEAARDAWLARAEIPVEQGHVRSVAPRQPSAPRQGSPAPDESRFEVLVQRSPDEPPAPLGGADISAVILAIGGVAGGGIRFLSGLGPEGRTFSLSLDAPVALRLGGREVALQSGALGADLQRLGVDALIEVGLSVDEQMLARAPDLYAVGDVVADRPRQALEAIYCGLGAARAVCRVRAPAQSF
jgi:glycerol-3-phosphate dehydrogenase subunit B